MKPLKPGTPTLTKKKTNGASKMKTRAACCYQLKKSVRSSFIYRQIPYFINNQNSVF